MVPERAFSVNLARKLLESPVPPSPSLPFPLDDDPFPSEIV
jgi:hypothetical protein